MIDSYSNNNFLKIKAMNDGNPLESLKKKIQNCFNLLSSNWLPFQSNVQENICLVSCIVHDENQNWLNEVYQTAKVLLLIITF